MPEDRVTCSACLSAVGTLYDGTERPYKTNVQDGREYYFCVDREACDRRWRERSKEG